MSQLYRITKRTFVDGAVREPGYIVRNLPADTKPGRDWEPVGIKPNGEVVVQTAEPAKEASADVKPAAGGKGGSKGGAAS